MMPRFWLDREQRRALAAWMLAGSGPALLAVIIAIVAILAWAIPGEALTRVNWLGSIAIALAVLLAISLLTYGVDQALRTIKASGGGVTFEATGQSAESATAPTVITTTETRVEQ